MQIHSHSKLSALRRGLGKTRSLGALGLLALCVALLAGCAARAQKSAVIELVVPRSCIQEVHLTSDTKCRGADAMHLICSGIGMTKIKDCGTLSVRPVR